jgi:hypothetical protein
MESADYGGLLDLLGWKRSPRLGEPGITRGAQLDTAPQSSLSDSSSP